MGSSRAPDHCIAPVFGELANPGSVSARDHGDRTAIAQRRGEYTELYSGRSQIRFAVVSRKNTPASTVVNVQCALDEAGIRDGVFDSIKPS